MEREYTVHFHRGKKVKIHADESLVLDDNNYTLYLRGKKVFSTKEYNIKFITIK